MTPQKHWLLLTTALCVLVTPALADTLPLKRVAISTSGLALFEHQGSVSGSTNIEVPVRLDAVDDVLKSLVVLDSAGEFGGVSLPGREPLSQSFRDLPFTREDLNSPVSLMNALQGAEIEITGASIIKGRLMNVVPETTSTENGDTLTRHRVSVVTPEGVKTALLENLNNVRFTETAVQKQIDRALEAVYINRIRDQRALTVSLKGTTTRPVGITYVQAAPLWKSAYRLVMPEGSDKAFLQGWAILENTTGIDWDKVDVTILSGAPVTYRQSLYESYYLNRPELPVKVMDRVMPRVDRGSLGGVGSIEGYIENEMLREESDGAMKKERRANAPAPAMMAKMAMADNAVSMESMGYGGAMPASAPMEMAQATMAVAQDAATQMVFTFPEPVTLAAGNSLMVPFVSRELPAERVWLYQPETNQGHPLATVEMDNNGETGLPPGILTLYEQNGPQKATLHVGDAEMPMVPKGESRFISYALDTKTKIDQVTQDDRQYGLLTISKGLLNHKVLWRNTTTYTIKAPAEEDRTLVVEHPRRPDWELVKPEGLDAEPEVTDTHYRAKISVGKGETKKLELTLQRDDTEVISLNGISPYDIDNRISISGKDLKAEVRRALEKIKELQNVVYSAQNDLNQLEQKRQEIFRDQERLRENLKTVAANNDLGKRYLKELNDQEDALARMKKEQEAGQQRLNGAHKALSDYIYTLEF
ncbi:MAG: hypothetical protein NDJ24_08345 [Alphaproteobacteria bacterium]|nr:hypothetical protein [Alphaproteobacteria bacterium]